MRDSQGEDVTEQSASTMAALPRNHRTEKSSSNHRPTSSFRLTSLLHAFHVTDLISNKAYRKKSVKRTFPQYASSPLNITSLFPNQAIINVYRIKEYNQPFSRTSIFTCPKNSCFLSQTSLKLVGKHYRTPSSFILFNSF